jgi:hypothetical protein
VQPNGVGGVGGPANKGEIRRAKRTRRKVEPDDEGLKGFKDQKQKDRR